MSPIQKSPKISYFFICENCDYKCCKQSEYNKHISTNKHKILQNPTLDTTTNSPKFSKIFECEKCDYTCCKKGDFNKHILTNKHKILQNPTLDTTPKVYLCKCGKKYKHSSTLYTHKKMCAYKENIVVENTPITTTDATNPIIIEKMFAMFTQMMTQNQDFMTNVIGKVQGITNNTNSHNTNNNQFNIQMFLNEHCKNAMNISDFIKSLPLTAQHYDNTKDNGLADTLTNLMVDGLNNLDVVERPIHCTDQKRKVMYVKDNNKWEKDTNNEIVTKNVKDLTILHRMNVDMWQEKNPKFNTDEDLQIAFSTIFSNLYADIIDERKGISKLMKGVIDATYLDDNTKKGFSKCDTLVSA
jgi:hypothetical protein